MCLQATVLSLLAPCGILRLGLAFSAFAALSGGCCRTRQVRQLRCTQVSLLLICASLPDEAILPIEMGDGAAPAAPEFKHLGSLLSQSFEDSVTIMDIIILARIAFTSNGHFRDEAGFTRIREDCLRIAHTLASTVRLVMLACRCENLSLLQRFHRKCVRIMCRVTRRHTQKHRISTDALEAKQASSTSGIIIGLGC